MFHLIRLRYNLLNHSTVICVDAGCQLQDLTQHKIHNTYQGIRSYSLSSQLDEAASELPQRNDSNCHPIHGRHSAHFVRHD